MKAKKTPATRAEQMSPRKLAKATKPYRKAADKLNRGIKKAERKGIPYTLEEVATIKKIKPKQTKRKG